MNLEEALQATWNGNSIAFLGSGFSRGALNLRGVEFKTADLLLDHLNSLSAGPQGGTLGDAADSYRDKFGDTGLVQELIQEFTATSITDYHEIIAQVPWRRVYTTNYDNVLELAAQKSRVRLQPITLKTDPFAARGDGMQYVHFNGSVEGLVESDIDSLLKLTETSYVTSSIATSPWATTFRNDLRLADSIIYFGYSLFDLDIKRIVYESPELHKKSFFILGLDPSDLTRQRVQKYGEIVTSPVADVAVTLNTFKTSSGKSVPNFHSLKAITPSSSNKSARDQDVFDLFELGHYHRGYIYQSISESGNYYLQRNVGNDILSLLEGSPAVVITASLGNGKTLALEGIAYQAIERGYKVFLASDHESKSAVEFERIAKLTEPTLILVDDYATWMKEIHSHALVRTPNAKLLLTARDITHDVLFERLESELGVGSVAEINIDKINESEARWFVDTLEVHGLWGDQAGKSIDEKIRIIKTALNSEIHAILLRLLKSTDIGDRLRQLVEGPAGKTPHADIVASVFILSSLKSGNPRIEMLGDIWGTELISSSSFRNDQAIRNLLDFDRWVIKARSSTVAQYFLQEILGQDVVPVLIKIMRALSTGSRGGLIGYKLAFEELMKFSTLQHILPVKGRLAAAIRFYEGAKDLPQAIRHPLFWFQFGIACLAEGDISRAKRYFTTAYAIADRTGFDTFQIDNHYARLLLVECSQIQMTALEAMDNFRRARAIINRQFNKERLAYPYRVARFYQDFIDRVGVKLDKNQLKEFEQAIEFVEERLAATDKILLLNRYVRECAHAMTYTKARCEFLIKKL